MTENKPMMIDGVDVSKCDNYMSDYQIANRIEGRYEHIKEVCECGERSVETFNFYCKDNPNCYYKQLARKTQECEELKKKVYKYELSEKYPAAFLWQEGLL